MSFLQVRTNTKNVSNEHGAYSGYMKKHQIVPKSRVMTPIFYLNPTSLQRDNDMASVVCFVGLMKLKELL